jgi:membrane protein YdbS with pleckstrin-like domain
MHFLKQELDKKGFSEEEKEMIVNRMLGHTLLCLLLIACLMLSIAISNSFITLVSAMVIIIAIFYSLIKWHTWRKYGASIEIEKSKLKKAEE